MPNSYISDDEDCDDTNPEAVKSRFGLSDTISVMNYISMDQLCDNDFAVYSNISSEPRKPRPESVLYRYPYDKCTCGYLKGRAGNTLFSFLFES